MKTALDILRERESKDRLSTGIAEVDEIIGGLEAGRSYLIYGDSSVDMLVHSTIAYTAGTLGYEVVYVNFCNYYEGKTLISPDALSSFCKQLGVEVKDVMDKVHSIFAFNSRQLEAASQKALETMKGRNRAVLLLIHNAARFADEEGGLESTRKVLTLLRQTCMELDKVLLATVEVGAGKLGEISKTPAFFRSLFNVILSIQKARRGYKATLIKHHYKQYPFSESFTLSKPAGVDLMGRVTPSFRQVYHKTVEQLRRKLREAFIDPRHRDGFDYLLENAWEREGHAMAESGLPTIDAMNMTAAIHLASKMRELEERVAELEKMLKRG